jgi:hypothetical protein
VINPRAAALLTAIDADSRDGIGEIKIIAG